MKPLTPCSLLLITLVLSACSGGGEKKEHTVIHLVSPDESQISVTVEIAADSDSHDKGLMGRESLGTDEGMLFVFPQEQRVAFWMKNTLIPLDLLFFRGNGELMSMTTMPLCDTDTCPSYPSEGLAQYALEVPQGFIARHQMGPKWKLALGPWAKR